MSTCAVRCALLMVGSIPVGRVVSQRWGKPRCANPDRLDVIAPRQLFERGVAEGASARYAAGWPDTTAAGRHRGEWLVNARQTLNVPNVAVEVSLPA